ncbi:glycosyltransferase family 2 protein [Serratia silvae]|uniref:Glycosyltransferase family 2 protein n=1 Tax=Serratia silvae TaxID=2824122 RepID=A0ABT0KHD0_9GAMM|nr:glycosyltransferase family 2 protein [Serratia silvae]MCL1031428.1 glycosyltransferase family 2 protein [Serratia silvae]
MVDKKVSIVIATYNGGKYVAEQMESILSSERFLSTIKEIIVTDDGSTDETLDIVSEYVNNYDFISLYKTSKNIGVVNNFMHGLSYATGDYIMFCDQDDFWLPHKIKVMHKKILDMEAEHGGGTPLLAFSDLKIVDEKLNETHPSFIAFNKITLPKACELGHLFLNNIAPGCVCIFNKALVENIDIKSTKGWLMHDWWFLLTAASLGRIGVVDEALMLYRQHGNNVVGASRVSTIKKLFMLKDTISNYRDSFTERLEQKDHFLKYLCKKDDKYHYANVYAKGNGLTNILRWGVACESTGKRKILFLLYATIFFFKGKI